MGLPAHMPMSATDDDDALPSDLAIRLLETILQPAGPHCPLIEREAILCRAKTLHAPQVLWWVEQVLGQLCTQGYVRRERGEHGMVRYCATSRWDEREVFLRYLRPPRTRIAYPRRSALRPRSRSAT